MSSESKKKRGMAGVANALTASFRGNGRAPDWQARSMGAYRVPRSPSSGSVFMRGLVGGILVDSLGKGKMVGDYDSMFAHAQRRVTHPILQSD